MKKKHDAARVTPVLVKLDADQSEQLRFIQGLLPVRPPLTGLVHGAVASFVEFTFLAYPEIKMAWDRRRTHLRLEP